MSFLLYHRTTGPTGRLIAQALGIPSGRLNQRNRGPMIRWGSAMDHPASTVLNQRQPILRSSDKLRAFQAMRDAGVRVPEFTTSRAEAQQWWQDNQRPIILGRTRHGMAARGIQVYEPGQALGEHELYVKHVPNQREYRVHVVRGEVIRVQGKYLDVPADHTNPYIKNHAQGFRFRTPERRLNRERTNQAINAVVALDLDFGAVDLCKGDDGQTYVFEVNTAPACSPMTLEAYVGAFTRILNERVAA